MMEFDDNIVNQAEILFDEIYGKGHGREMTVSRYILVLGVTESQGQQLFDMIYNGENVSS